MSSLFPDMVLCMQIQVLEIKKSECMLGAEADGQWCTSTSSTMGDRGRKRLRMRLGDSFP